MKKSCWSCYRHLSIQGREHGHSQQEAILPDVKDAIVLPQIRNGSRTTLGSVGRSTRKLTLKRKKRRHNVREANQDHLEHSFGNSPNQRFTQKQSMQCKQDSQGASTLIFLLVDSCLQGACQRVLWSQASLVCLCSFPEIRDRQSGQRDGKKGQEVDGREE